MNITIKEIDLIKLKLDKLILKINSDTKSIPNFECSFFRFINEIIIIKSCIDNKIIETSMQIENIESIKKDLSEINSIFSNIFSLGQSFHLSFNEYCIDELLKIFTKYEYFKLDFDLLGKLYQPFINKDQKKEFGQFYTPESIINEILFNLDIINNEKLDKIKIIDPSCGTGSFLSRLTNQIIKKYLGKKDNDEIIEIIENSIYGLDIMEFAIYITKSNLLLQIIPLLKLCNKQNINFKIYKTDTLRNLTNKIEDKEDKIIIDIKQRKGDFKSGFDYVIGNPPYFKIRNITASQKEYFRDILFGQQNIYSLFLYFGIKILKPKGKIGFIIPESIRTGNYFKNIRSYIINTCTISHIITFDCRKTNFDNALQGVMIICANKIKYTDLANKQIQIKNVTNKDLLADKKFNNKVNIKYVDVVRVINNYQIILVCSKKEHYDLINSIYNNCYFLTNNIIGYKVNTGKLVWNQVEKRLTNNLNETSIKIIWASYIDKYNINFMKKVHYKYVNPDNKLINLTNKGKTVLLKRTTTKEQAKRLVACLFNDLDEYYIENHINYFTHHNENSPITFEFLTGLLNSKLINFIISQIAGNTQVSATELNLLPIKFNLGSIEIISNCVGKYLIKENNNICNEINDEVYKLYNLTNEEINTL